MQFSLRKILITEIDAVLSQRWSPRGQNLKSLASKVKSLTLASKPASPQKCPMLGPRTALFFDLLKTGQDQRVYENFFEDISFQENA